MAEPAGRPLIGITGPRRGAWGPRVFVHLGVWLAGGRPVHLRPRQPAERPQLHGYVVTGGHDVQPVLYMAAPEVPGNYDEERDAFESEIIRQAIAARIPLLGICRGMQLLNVHMGGTLIQDLKDHRSKTSNRSTLLPLKALLTEPQSRLYALLACDRLRINSLHRQSIRHLGAGLRVAGHDRDHIVQAVEAEDAQFPLGVQWHPEFLLYMARHRRLFAALVAAARERHGQSLDT